MASTNVAKYLQVVSLHDNLQAIPLRAKDCVASFKIYQAYFKKMLLNNLVLIIHEYP